MSKKLFILFAVLIMQFLISFNSNAVPVDKEDSGGYLKIFTPCHRIKSVSISDDKALQAFTHKSENNIYKIFLTEDEIELVAKTVYAESKGEPYIGKVGVASVILNRLEHPQFPKSIKGIIFQKNAFSCITTGYNFIKPDLETYKAVYEALRGNDPTDNALYFYNPKTATCQWIKKVSKNQITQIGNHIFFR